MSLELAVKSPLKQLPFEDTVNKKLTMVAGVTTLVQEKQPLSPQKINLTEKQLKQAVATPKRGFSSSPPEITLQNIDSNILREFQELVDPSLPEKTESLLIGSATKTNPATMSAPQLCLRELLTLKLTNPSLNIDPASAMVLEVGAGRGNMGQLLTEIGFQHIYAQEGSQFKAQQLIARNFYESVENFIIGKQALPKTFRRKFDVVLCQDGLGPGKLNACAISEIFRALNDQGLAVLTMPEAMLDSKDPFNCGYYHEIQSLKRRGQISLIHQAYFSKYQGICQDFAAFKGQKHTLLIFQKNLIV